MFLSKYTLGKRVGRIAGHDVYDRPAQNVSSVKLIRNDMDRTARDRIARRNRARVGVEPLVFRQQRGVDVDDPAMPTPDKSSRKDAHISCKRNSFDTGFSQRPIHRGFLRFLADAARRQCKCREMLLPGPFKTRSIDAVGSY